MGNVLKIEQLEMANKNKLSSGNNKEIADHFVLKSDILIEEYEIETNQLHTKSLCSLRELEDKEKICEELKEINWSFSDNDTTYLTHDIHPYPAKFIPQIPSNIINKLSLPGELVWDPFGGSGTTALEALLLGRRAISTDANPLASVIGNGKTLTVGNEEHREFTLYKQWLENALRNGIDESLTTNPPSIPNIEKWFNKNVIKELSFIKGSLENLSEISRSIAKVALSRTVAKMSNQDGETRYASVERNIKNGETLYCFLKDLDMVFSKVLATSKLLKGKKAIFGTFDLRSPLEDSNLLNENQIDLIVTSPPYANVTDYHLYHRFRMFWLGFDPIDFGKKEIGSHLRHQKEKTGFDNYMEEMELCLKNCYRALKPGRYAVFVIGDSVFNKVVYDTTEAYIKVASNIGFEYVGDIKRDLHTVRRSFEGPARRAKDETILILRKPPKKVSLILQEPSYKLWQYEEELFLREVKTIFGEEPIKLKDKKWSLEIDCYDLDKVKRLTFIHRFDAEDVFEDYTWQYFLEKSDSEDINSSRRESKYLTHGIHDYKGKYYPQLCKSLLNLAGVKSGSSILDPFGGSGTTALEGTLNGYKVYSCDMNPLAVKIQKAKIDVLELNPTILLDALKSFLFSMGSFNNSQTYTFLFEVLPQSAHQELESWFPQRVLNKLSFILEKIHKIPDGRISNLLKVVLSNIIREVSQQDPSDLRIRRRSEQLVDAPVIELFTNQLQTQLRKLECFLNSIENCPFIFQKPTIWEGDSRDFNSFSKLGLKEGSIDAIVTSPPYATALPYIDTNRLSLLVLMGLTSSLRSPIEEELVGTREIKKTNKNTIESRITNGDFSNIISPYAKDIIEVIHELNNTNNVGFRRKNMASLLYKYFSDMTYVLSNLNRLLKPNGSVFLVIGNNVTSSGETKINIETTRMLVETGEYLGWSLQEEIPITVTSENLKHISNTIKQNSILWFKKN